MITKAHMTIKPHLFFSSFIHMILLAYLVSIPIYKGSLYSMSFGHYSVDLVTEGNPAAKAPVTRKAPQAKAPAPARQQKAVEKGESPPVAEASPSLEVPKTEEPVAEPAPQNEAEPEGITLLPEEPKKTEPMIAKAEPPVIENKPEPEKKPEPPKREPVILPPPPEQKPEPEIKELSLPKEPEPFPPAETKPSLADPIEEPAQSEFPVKADEKAGEVSPLTEGKREPKADPMSEMRHLDREFRSEITTPYKRPDQGITNVASAGKVQEKAGNKGPAKAKAKAPASAKAEPSAPKSGERSLLPGGPSEAASSARSDSGSGSEGDSRATDTGKGKTAGIIVPEANKPKDEPKKKPSLGIAVSDALFYRDIKIEVSLKNAEAAGLTSRLTRKSHPSVEEYGRPEEKTVRLTEETEDEGKTIFWVAKAEKGIYTFVMQNTSETLQEPSLMIRLLEGKKGARNRKLEAVNIPPRARLTVKFVLPEGIFWDDESYFTGAIESSDSVTKFNDSTGIVWKENKE